MTKPRSSRVLEAPTRRQFIGVSVAAIAAAARHGAVQAASRAPGFAYVGTFTSETRNARGEGLSAYRIDPESGRWARVQLLNREVNPSYLAIDRGAPVLYAVHADANQVSAFSVTR